jgi:elongation factor 2 kinase
MHTAEGATKHVYDLAARKWSTSKVRIKLDTVPFAKGGLRLVYHMQELDCEEDGTYVAKLSMDANDRDDQDIYFRDVEMQSVAKYYAKLFNEYNPPKKVDFVKAWLLQLDDREGSPICGVERFIDGPYRKHNNNFGFVSDEERHTPQSFSHFSYESSNHGLLVCDIQGVSDLYTDPQVHSADGQSFGKGNLGQRGIDRFIQSHRCNAICRYLKLPSINANYAGLGTLPVTQYMKHTRVEVVHIGSFPRLERPATITEDLSRPLLSEPAKEDSLCRFCLLL